MRLPIQLLQKIIGHPVSHFSGSGHHRAVGRVAVETTATVFPLQGDLLDDPFTVTLSDISAETVGLTSPWAMMPHSTLILSIPLAEGEKQKPAIVRCRVMRCSPDRDGRFHVAAQFLGLCTIQNLNSRTKSVL
ncbi:MAG: PilZ domain-containing protein [Methylacidiphilales bacterium]|nr:PilZ domain-containing protein [Candidatus Methylacidiphilales bacterium]